MLIASGVAGAAVTEAARARTAAAGMPRVPRPTTPAPSSLRTRRSGAPRQVRTCIYLPVYSSTTPPAAEPGGSVASRLYVECHVI